MLAISKIYFKKIQKITIIFLDLEKHISNRRPANEEKNTNSWSTLA